MRLSAVTLWVAETFIDSTGCVSRRLYGLMLVFWFCLWVLASQNYAVFMTSEGLFEVWEWASSVVLISSFMSLANLTNRRFRDAGKELRGRYARICWIPGLNVLMGLGLMAFPSVPVTASDNE